MQSKINACVLVRKVVCSLEKSGDFHAVQGSDGRGVSTQVLVLVFICILAFVTAMQEQDISFAKQKIDKTKQKQTNKQIMDVKADDRGEYHKKKENRTYQRVLLCVCVCLSFTKDRQKD